MIDEIHVSNVALIRDASFSPSRGLTAITGETGAGKTALLSACKLLVGERADKAAVREGSDRLSVEGRLFFDNAADIPEGVELEDGEAVVCRRVSIDGRSRASVNGHMASAKEIARLVAPTPRSVQSHEHQALMRPQRIFPCSTLGRRIPLARLAPTTFWHSKRRSTPPTSFRA